MNLIKPTFLLRVFGATTFVTSTCSGDTLTCALTSINVLPLWAETSYKVGKVKKDGCQAQ
ncbi:hypothetical protein MJO28_000320 [Puccinia striiformis f. sp. tritici]|uniref:Uncharacterized protein n=2 Tax=Puccinia striiformis f. sp. tritici TaxID=168172 RepID=A0ACC0EXM0_9BASI|nr:hypothetical protein MJO28_000319 [Puccinia striiformis f. sp. tritici]KAI7962226.1 hypothetical protein MJO28_000320 [Puccinia striiformis f. sp. tritici]